MDFGFKRIGIAVAETSPQIITARPAIEASGTLKVDAARLSEMAKREEAELLVLGLPVEESGEEGRMARICRTLAGLIGEHGVRVELVDERMSSIEAENLLRSSFAPGASAHDGESSGKRKRSDGDEGGTSYPQPPSSSRHESSGKRKGALRGSQIRKLRDGEAARVILERYIAEQLPPQSHEQE